jgi:excisionase family DNA binding protein
MTEQGVVAVDAAPPPGPPAETDGVLTAEGAARLLRVSRWTLYAAVGRGEVPHRRVGRRMLFSRRALLLWLEGASPRSVGKEM